MELLGALFASSKAAYLVYARGTDDASDIGFSLNMAGEQRSLIPIQANLRILQ